VSIYYIVKKSDKKYEKKVGWMKKIAADFAIVHHIYHKHTLSGSEISVYELIQRKYGDIPGMPGTDIRTRKRAMRNAITHTRLLRTLWDQIHP